MNGKQIAKLIVGVGRGRIDPPEASTNQKKTPIVVATDTGEVLAKCCSKCGVVKLRKDMALNGSKKDGMASKCLLCVNDYDKTPKGKQSKTRRNANYCGSAKGRRKKAGIEAKRRAVKRNLPSESIADIPFDTCVLTGATDNIHREHFVPLSWNHGGTYPGNVYAMQGSANESKGDRNPYEWFRDNGERYGITSEAWNALIEELADRNGMNPDEYIDFVNWCYDNPRTWEQVIADNERYGYIVDSATLWRDSTANVSETTAEASTFDAVPV